MAEASARSTTNPVSAVRKRLWTAGPDVVTRRLGDRLVVVCLRTNRIFELNFTGARIWELVGEGRDEDDIVAVLVKEFHVTPEIAAREIGDLKRRLLDAGLIEVASAG